MSAARTRSEFLRLPEGYPAELVEGHLLREAAPRYGHQRMLQATYEHVRATVPLERVVVGPIDVAVDELNVLHPDLAVYAEAPPANERGTRLPLVVFEVLSEATRDRDQGIKRKRYVAAGIPEVWLLDAAYEAIEVHRAGEEVERAVGNQEAHSRVLAEFRLRPGDLFA